MKWFVILLIVVPAVEIWGLISVGQWLGGWQTFGLLLVMGFLGAYFAKREGTKVWAQARSRMAGGQLPADSLLDGICIFAGGILMMTPGFFTDVLGFLLVLPVTRPIAKGLLLGWIRKRMDKGNTNIFFFR